LTKGEKHFFCDKCPRKKKITGATMEGTRTAAICHFAIQHYELRGVLEKDTRLSALQKIFFCVVHPLAVFL
jgi:hypothetical protein